jgi:hypothetical protein
MDKLNNIIWWSGYAALLVAGFCWGWMREEIKKCY